MDLTDFLSVFSPKIFIKLMIILQKMLEFNQDRRISALEVLKHRYFRDGEEDPEEEEDREDSSMSLNESQDTSVSSNNSENMAEMSDSMPATDPRQSGELASR